MILVTILALLAGGSGTDRGQVVLSRTMRELGTELRVLNLATHPDDEDGAVLAYCSAMLGAKAFTLYANKGEGGQNEIGPELYQELGALREEEAQRAARILGSEPYFLNLTDFGFSKRAEEAFKFWGGEDRVVGLVTEMIRRLRPHVIFTNHNTTDGHGQHRAFAIAARKAFAAAADPKAYREQLRNGLETWQVERFFTRVGNTESDNFVIDVGDYDSISGLTCEEIAATALREHRTQGQGGRDPLPHHSLRRFALTLTVDPHGPVWPSHWRLLPETLKPWQDTTPDLPSSKLFGALVAFRASRSAPMDLEPVNDALAASAHLALRVRPADTLVVPQQETSLEVVLDTPIPELLSSECTFNLKGRGGIASQTYSGPIGAAHKFEISIPSSVALGWPKSRANYQLRDPRERELLLVSARPRPRDTTQPIELIVPTGITVAPAVELRLTRAAIPVIEHGAAPTLTARVTNHAKERLSANVLVELPASETPHEPLARTSLAPLAEDQSRDVLMPLSPPEGTASLRVRVVPSEELAPTLAEDAVALKKIDVKVASGTRVGLVRSYDDTLQEAFRDLGIDCELLGEADLVSGDLKRFHTIVIDIRAYLVRPDLRANNERLLQYVARGGRLVVMYQRPPEWNPKENGGHSYAPFKLEVTSARTCEEDAAVKILKPGHVLLTFPNEIEASDFDGWVQERGLYFPDHSYDEHCLELLECHDTDEPERKGGLLFASYGQGDYIYCAYAIYRQVRALVPGGYRLLANLVSRSP
jgi:LmbE family N-acetylglucosaminyl deacetylase